MNVHLDAMWEMKRDRLTLSLFAGGGHCDGPYDVAAAVQSAQEQAGFDAELNSVQCCTPSSR